MGQRQAQRNTRERAAAARATAQARERRRRMILVTGVSIGVLAVIGIIVGIGLSSSGKTPTASPRTPAPTSVVSAVASVPAATINAIGAGTLSVAPHKISDTALTAGGKPEVLYVGAEFCPYCAAERWAMVQALSRFGTFTNLGSIRSSPTDVFPNTATFSFHGASYSSSTIAFVAREVETVTGAKLETPTAAESALWLHYTGQGSFPFLDIGGRYVLTNPSYDPAVLKGLSMDQIAADLATPTSPVAKAIVGTANVLTAAICSATGGTPASVCTAPGVVAAQSKLGG
jgi:Domain of unknown function (DUF929)